MEEFMSNQSTQNLKAAFAGESQANRRYLAFAKKADEEGYPNIARFFRAAAQSETFHAFNHLKAMDGIKSTLENAKEAWQGEKDEFTDMYPQFMDQAKKEQNNAAFKTFFWANEAEKVHGSFYEKAVKALEKGTDMPLNDVYVCSVCGFTVEDTPPEKCPVCGQPKERFEKVK
jgi:rubrerythrin